MLCSAPQQLMPGVWDPRGITRPSKQLEAARQAAASAALHCSLSPHRQTEELAWLLSRVELRDGARFLEPGSCSYCAAAWLLRGWSAPEALQEPAMLHRAPQQLMPGVCDPRGVCARLSEQLAAAGQAAAPGGAALQCVAQLAGAGVAMVNSGAARNARWSGSPSMALEPSVPRCVPLGNACWSSARALQPGDF